MKSIFISIMILLIISIPANSQNRIRIEKRNFSEMTYNLNQKGDLDINNTQNDTTRLSPEEFMYSGQKRYTITGELPYKNESHIRPIPLAAFSAVYGTFLVSQHVYQMNTIWSETGSWDVKEDGMYALYSDKAGHFFGCYLTSYVFRESMIASGFDWETSNITGTILGLSYSTYIEIMDGFGTNWGFSPSDFYADLAGAALFLGQAYFPVLQNFTPKFMYFPADWHGELPRYEAEFFNDDYSSHTLWLSVNVHNLLPEDIRDYWPEWLEISFGYAARGLVHPDHKPEHYNSELHYHNGVPWVHGDPKFIIALDYNLVKLLPDGPAGWNWFKQSLNMFKLPSPAIEFGKVTKVYLTYPFHF